MHVGTAHHGCTVYSVHSVQGPAGFVVPSAFMCLTTTSIGPTAFKCLTKTSSGPNCLHVPHPHYQHHYNAVCEPGNILPGWPAGDLTCPGPNSTAADQLPCQRCQPCQRNPYDLASSALGGPCGEPYLTHRETRSSRR